MIIASRAFSLIELLVVLAVIALTCSILMPALGAVRSRARSAVCGNNLRQLVLANSGYATENGGFYVQAAADLWDNAGRQRWHGVRDRLDEPFDPAKGPLARYLADGTIRQCPQKIHFLTGKAWAQDFEQGCGGYGYNMAYLGSRLWDRGCATADATLAYVKTTRMTEVARPCQTLMFGDTAMCTDGTNLIEYSFAEPPHPVVAGQVIEQVEMSPSIHFRHSRSTNAGWSDGHVDRQVMAGSKGENAYGVRSSSLSLGWFEPEDNSLFDLH
jgi:prepilin-type N-terminal cleavage/methylation domain-containing protein/prepilin-type processing-associated H-X9-DG protein